MRFPGIAGESFHFGFNEDGCALFLAQLFRKIRTARPLVDTPAKMIEWLKGSSNYGTAITAAQRSRVMDNFLCACIAWHTASNPLDRQGKGINEAALEDTDPL